MKPRAVVLLNAAAGSVAAGGPADVGARVRVALAGAGLTADVRAVDGRSLAAEVRSALAARPDVLVVGGGDGTLSSAAEALVGGPTPLGILPLGTRNHFARDLGLALDLEEAASVIAAGHVRRVDVGEVNGRVFLNNCSLGVYPDLVRDRETQEARDDRRRWAAILRASWNSLWRFRVRTVTLRVDGRVWRVTTPLVFVGNNRYETRLLALGRRSALADGQLWLYVARNASRLGVVRLGARMALGRLEQAQDFEAVATTELELRTRRRHLRLAVDGEVLPMVSPVRWRARPRALAVLAPAVPA
jgi:diacylglycerol kinase family enzyme